jgi:DNA-binding beta-propeller fold protein YncE
VAEFFAVLLVYLSLVGLHSISANAASPTPPAAARWLYAVNQAAADRGSFSVYDIEAGHRLVKTIGAVPNVGDVRGVAVGAVSGKLFVAYQDLSGAGRVYCLNVYDDAIVWNRPVNPGVDRLAIDPNGKLLYVPTWEGGSADYINVVDADTGDVVRKVYFSNRCTTLSTRYPGRSSRRPRPMTGAAVTCI